MEFHLSWVLPFLALAVVASQAALSPEQYWKYVLPNTPMPKVVQDMLLHPEKSTFLPRQIAQKIPFSSNKLPEILNKFSVTPGSAEAEMMKNTIKECEAPQIRGEKKYCATSLESMIDFSTSKIGKNVQAISTEVEKQTPLQKYTIAYGVQKISGDKSVVCHKQNYLYAVFYCHRSEKTRAYMVPLEGADGTKAKAVAICHTDTSAWNPKHVAFQVLKVEPGTIPICHFLPKDHIFLGPQVKA
ncbi:hypothetical protein CCACVL1_23195 [Corchorus capsularis]|uniref:BURP domain-containing protein n=1 Tax=Corchorus capsularis TaxID=210143 RepID=A0A1R3GUV2_COCAP|nr:hypothetical protein CCACVL1_23195 [Corchorus capsularis]